MSTVIARADGIYVRDDAMSHDVKLDSCAHVINGDGSITVRFPARDCTVEVQPVFGQCYDTGDLARLVLAVVRGVITIAQISAVKPGVAVAVQTFMTNNGLVAAGSPQP
jgi:hypothetical protein